MCVGRGVGVCVCSRYVQAGKGGRVYKVALAIAVMLYSVPTIRYINRALIAA